MKSKVLVFDGRSRAALSIIRSLSKEDIYIIIGESFKTASFYSKYVSEKLIYPDPVKDKESFIEFLYDYLKKNKIDVIIPVRDDITEILITNKDKFIDLTNFLLPDLNAFNKTRDKSETIRLARTLNIPHPHTILTYDEDYSLETLKKQFDLPVIIKPRISSGSRGITIVKSWEEFEEKLKEVSKEFPFPMIQEFIEHGGAFGVSMLYINGEAYASFTHKRIREFPLSGGPSTFREGVEYPEIESYARSLLSEIKWNGVAMVEYRIDKKTGVPKLMEINPRFWGSLQTAVFSGVDFPYLVYKYCMEGKIEKVFTYPLSKKARWLFFGDILWFIYSKKTFNNIKSFFTFKSNDLSYDIFSWKDIGPTYGIIKEAISSLFKSNKIKHIFKRGW